MHFIHTKFQEQHSYSVMLNAVGAHTGVELLKGHEIFKSNIWFYILGW